MSIILPSLKQIKKKYRKLYPPDFITHLNYVSCLMELSEGIEIIYNSKVNNKISENKTLKKKVNLIKLTLKSIDGEYKNILENPDYAEVCVSWISVKSYYMFFNLLLILNYLISANESCWRFGHEKLHNRFEKLLKNEELEFNKKLFNTNFDCCKILNIDVSPGANIKLRDVNITERVCQVLKKIIYYALEDLKRKREIKNFYSKKNREIKKRFLQDNKINICEFFYWYRIKANYRDLEFLNKNIDNEKFSKYYCSYYKLTINFYNAFKKLINNLSIKRFDEEIL